MRNYAFNFWKNKGLREVLSTTTGFIFFLFDCVESSTNVVEDGPWFFGGHFLVLKKWHNMMKLSKERLDRILIWIKLFNIRLEYWDDDGLSRIASARISFAKTCMEIGLDSSLPTDFLIKCEDQSVEIGVEYLWTPSKCSKCKVFGYMEDKCIKTQVENLSKEK